MVHGHSDVPEAHTHAVAMAEQHRKDFHHESAFMRFRPLSEHGTWQGRRLSQLTPPVIRRGSRTDVRVHMHDPSGLDSTSRATSR